MKRHTRGVSLIEGLMASVILLIGMVGIFQGMIVASIANSSANKRTRAAAIAAELAGAVEHLGRTALVTDAATYYPSLSTTAPAGGLTDFTAKDAFWVNGFDKQIPTAMTGFQQVQYINVDDGLNSGGLPTTPIARATPGYTVDDARLFERVVAVYRSNDNRVVYVSVNVGWREAGRVKAVHRLTGFFDSSATNGNGTNFEY